MSTPPALQGPASSVKPAESLRAHWLQSAGVGVMLQGAGLSLAFASSVLLARLLGPHGLGQYSYVLAIVAVLSVLATVGLPTVVTRLLAAYQTKEDWGKAHGLLRWSNFVVGVLGMLLGLCLVVGGLGWNEGEQRWLYIFAAPLVVVLAWANLRQRALQGLHRPIAAQLPEQIVKHSVFLAVGGALWIAEYPYVMRSDGVMAVWLIAGVVSFLSGVELLRRLSPPVLHKAQCQYKPAEWHAIAFPIFLADLLTVVLANSDTIILGWLRTPEEVGLYQIGLRVSGLMLVLLAASNWVLAPWFARFHETGEKDRLQRVVTRTTRAIFTATVVPYIVVVFWGEVLLGIIFGEEYIEAYPILLILGAAQLVNVASGPVVNLLAMTGGQRELVWSVAATVVFNIILCLLLIPAFGMLGAAISVAISISAYNALLAVVVKRRYGIATTIFG